MNIRELEICDWKILTNERSVDAGKKPVISCTTRKQIAVIVLGAILIFQANELTII